MVGHFNRDPVTFAARKVFSTRRGFFKQVKSEGLFSTGNATNLLCVFLYENCTDNTRRLHGAQSVPYHLPQPCHAIWPAPIPLLLPIPQQTKGSHVIKVEADSAAVPLCRLYSLGCWSLVFQMRPRDHLHHLPTSWPGRFCYWSPPSAMTAMGQQEQNKPSLFSTRPVPAALFILGSLSLQ